MIFDQYDQIRIVNLPERTDRKREMDEELAKIGLLGNSKVQYFSAIRMTEPGPFRRVGSHGNFLSQLTILEDALKRDQSVIIMEDDCQFTDDVRTFSQKADTDILYGGGDIRSSVDGTFERADITGSHFMGFSKNVLRDLVPFLRSLLDLQTEIDPKIVESDFDPLVRPPIDGSYVWFRRYHPEYQTEFANLAGQRASATDVGDRKWFDNVPILKGLANSARRILR